MVRRRRPQQLISLCSKLSSQCSALGAPCPALLGSSELSCCTLLQGRHGWSDPCSSAIRPHWPSLRPWCRQTCLVKLVWFWWITKWAFPQMPNILCNCRNERNLWFHNILMWRGAATPPNIICPIYEHSTNNCESIMSWRRSYLFILVHDNSTKCSYDFHTIWNTNLLEIPVICW